MEHKVGRLPPPGKPPAPKKGPRMRAADVPFALDEVVYLQIRRNGKLITIQEDENSQPTIRGFAG